MADVPPESPTDQEAESAGSPAESSESLHERSSGSDGSPAGERREAAGTDDDAPQVVGVDSDAAEDLLGALSSEMARAVLDALHEDPATASQLADRLDASLQTVHYHLENLSEADVVEVAGTTTSDKGREMDLYAPAGGPVVVFAGDEDDGNQLRDALKRLVSAFGFLALASLLIQEVLGEGVRRLWESPERPTGDVTVAETTREAAGIEPGVAFFAGGAIVILAAFAVWYWQWRRD